MEAGDDEKGSSYSLRERVGLDELLTRDVWRASFAELFGAAVLIFMVDAIVISTLETNVTMPNLIMGILIGITIALLMLALFPVSGGHLSPIISISAALVGLISLSRALAYLLAQCIGSVLGALAFRAVVAGTIADKFSLGGCTITVVTPGADGPITTGLGTAQAFWIETFCSFCLLISAVWVAYHPQLRKSLGLFTVCSIVGVVVAVLVFISTTVTTKKGYAGAGMNPARCLAAALVRGGHLWDGHWVFWVGPIVACFGFYFYTKVISDEEFQAQGHKYDFLEIIKGLIACSKKGNDAQHV
ncbi:OLC1v1003405C1 [Oldenlandia corymbosa var. corymbosa]|uniref:OLC1v1003405C1 n=1 Tax=Oldenlandia corymbosa var. corymbosa TaxID=529605 RepID=A0AAV1D9Y8_OLDCO|nr:OLC1v1003405C1 [Oldenlandia corymbosa var. corymbosa]